MEIPRPLYLNALVQRRHNGLVKVVTGIRRAGKSYLLFTIFTDWLRSQGIDDDHIIRIVLDDLESMPYRDPLVLLRHIKSLITDGEMYYILLDEVQMVDRFEELLNSLLHIKNADIYVTGSNSRFLSRDIITEFRGRGDEVHLYPLKFSEFMSVFEGDVRAGWNEYVTYGGLPAVLLQAAHPQKSKYLRDLFSETYLKDIVARNHIRNTAELEALIDILSSSIGSLTNPQRIVNTFRTVEKSSISAVTVASYLAALQHAFLITGVKRFDVRGRHYIGSPLKYYFEDAGLRNARLNFRQQEETYLMENIIYNELRARGFDVDVGVVERVSRDASGARRRVRYEVDFVVNQGSRRYYIQSAFALPDADKVRQEKRPLLSIDDSFKKIIVVKDDMMLKRDEDGIVTMGLFEFLLDEGSLDR